MKTPPFKNTKGSTIKRGGSISGFKYPIGKVIGGKVYMHLNYIDTLPNPEQAQIALKATGSNKMRCLSYDPKNEVYMFSESPDFDSADEPIPGKAIKVEMDGDDVEKVFPAKVINQIWHHKWMFVDDNYKGFDVRRSWEWSVTWASEISNPSGSKAVWHKQLVSIGLRESIQFFSRINILKESLCVK